MTTQEFSNAFDTLLNSYNTQAQFGEQASKREITLDEYEKSIFLTQAQDIVVKQYFDIRTDGVQEGFDGSERRQMDFSSLNSVKTLNSVETTSQNVSIVDATNGNMGVLRFTLKKTDSLHKWNIKITLSNTGPNKVSYSVEHWDDDSGLEKEYNFYITLYDTDFANADLNGIVSYWKNATFDSEPEYEGYEIEGKLSDFIDVEIKSSTGKVLSTTPASYDIANFSLRTITNLDTFDDRGIMFTLPDNVLFMLNEKLEVTTEDKKERYTVIPIHYREYDRQNSKPYSQPYKKQCWRLFQNFQGFDILSEIIPVWDTVKPASIVQYKIRYVRRPKPIVLVNLPDDLAIDGEQKISECELNPIIHMDILNTAVDLAIRSRGGVATTSEKERQS